MAVEVVVTAEHQRHLEAAHKDLVEQLPPEAIASALAYNPDDDAPPSTIGRSRQWQEGSRRRLAVLDGIRAGGKLADVLVDAGVNHSTYKSWRRRFKKWAAAVDVARAGLNVTEAWDGSSVQFAQAYFGWTYTWFQLMWINEQARMPPGNVLLTLWPPEHGKTSVAENRANEQFARRPDFRLTVASESQSIARKILARVKNRMEPGGPTPAYVERWGPFAPQTGFGRRTAQPWGADYFNVYKKSDHDERDYSMQALGVGSSIVSTRCDQLHADDLQSIKSFSPAKTDRIEDWFRQDALSRPGEHGVTTVSGTRVGDDDIYERIENDEEMNKLNIVKTLKFPAIITDQETGEQRPLMPERYTLDSLERQKAKVGQEAWDRNYMQNPGRSKKGKGTFTSDDIGRCLRPEYSLLQRPTEYSIVYVGLDPALGSKNCVIACEVLPEGKLLVRRIREDVGLQRNEQIMSSLGKVIDWCNQTGRVTEVVIEAKNFQAGLARDERLQDMRRAGGWNMGEHLTGINKYDDDIGVASMASSFIRGEILLPWADDNLTRTEIGELVKQLEKWKPGARGTKLRQDRVMALWFVWILWHQRWKGRTDTTRIDAGFKRPGLPWGATPTGLLVPQGA